MKKEFIHKRLEIGKKANSQQAKNIKQYNFCKRATSLINREAAGHVRCFNFNNVIDP